MGLYPVRRRERQKPGVERLNCGAKAAEIIDLLCEEKLDLVRLRIDRRVSLRIRATVRQVCSRVQLRTGGGKANGDRARRANVDPKR